MPEIAYKQGEAADMYIGEIAGDLWDWLNANVKPIFGRIALDTEASGLHVDGDWASDDGKCSPPARVSIVSMAWRDHASGVLCSVAIPFDQGKVGGKPGRFVGGRAQAIEHTAECLDADGSCVCAPWNWGHQAWQELCRWLWHINSIDYFNAKYDMWIMLAGLRNGAHVGCGPDCVGWKHQRDADGSCVNSGIDLSSKLGNDVMITESLFKPAEPCNLDQTSKRYLHRGKDQGMDAGLKANGVGLGKRYDLVSWEIAAPYAALDAELTYLDSEIQRDMDSAELFWYPELPALIRKGHNLCKLLFTLEQRGVSGDWEDMRSEARKMHTEVAKLEAELPFQPPNNNSAAKYFFGSQVEGGLGLIPVKLTPGGKPSCDAEVVARLAQRNDKAGEVARAWSGIANMKSACAKWYDSWPERAGADGRIRTNFRQCKVESDRKDARSGGAISGRLSADRVQLQGVPQDWRIPKHVRGIKKKKDGTPGLIVARPGYSLWEVDASNCEVRVAAWVSRCKKLAKVINSGVNIHDMNTRNIFGIEDDNPLWEQYRTSAKRGIFGRMYGAGIRTLKAQIDADLKADVPERDIRNFMDKLDDAYPELKWTARACERKANTATGGPGYVTLVDGRRRVFGWGEKTYKAFNAVIQGGVAVRMIDLMLVVEEIYPQLLLGQVHDSMWLEIPNGEENEVIPGVQALGKRMFEESFSTEEIPIAFEFDAKMLAGAK